MSARKLRSVCSAFECEKGPETRFFKSHICVSICTVVPVKQVIRVGILNLIYPYGVGYRDLIYRTLYIHRKSMYIYSSIYKIYTYKLYVYIEFDIWDIYIQTLSIYRVRYEIYTYKLYVYIEFDIWNISNSIYIETSHISNSICT